MSSSFIQIKPIGSHPMGMLQWNYPLTLSSSPDFPQARRRVSCNLFGRPERGAINEIYRQEEKQRLELFQDRYSLYSEELPQQQQQHPKSKPTNRPTIISTATNIAESRLSDGESLIEKELREHEMKLKQRKKTVNCNEKYVVAAAAGDRIKSRNLKLEEHNTAAAAAAARTFVDSSKCASGNGERPKPYARQQSSMTDYYTQRKTVVCNNSRTTSEVSLVEEATEVLPHLLDESIETPTPTKTTTISTSAVSNNESLTSSSSSSSSSSTTHPHQCEDESSQEQISLHTMTTDVSAELA